jgi:glycosyltransferase involved in cell wall biosynthesis
LAQRLLGDFDVWVLAPHAPGAAANEELDGLRVARFRYAPAALETLAYGGGILANLRQHRWRWSLVPPFLLAQWLAAMRLVRRERVDVIHAHWVLPQGALAVVASLVWRRLRVVVTAHGSDLSDLSGRLLSNLKRWVLRRADAVTVTSDALRASALEHGAAPTSLLVAPMGVDVHARFVPDTSTARSASELLYVGRLAPEKGVETFLRAMPAVLAACPAATLTVIGDGPLAAAMHALASRLGVAERVSFVGALANERLPAYYRRAAITVIPSFREGYGLACVEAMACACPVAASDLPSLRTLLCDGACGELFPAGDVAALARSLATLLADPGARERLGTAGRRQAEIAGDWQAAAHRYSRLLQDVVGKSR